MNTVRIETDGLVGRQARVFFQPDDGEEVDISSVCTGVRVDIRVDDANTAVLELIKVDGLLHAELVDVVVKHVRPKRQRFWRRLSVHDVTTAGDRFRRWVRA